MFPHKHLQQPALWGSTFSLLLSVLPLVFSGSTCCPARGRAERGDATFIHLHRRWHRSNSTRKCRSRKVANARPPEPYPDFPLSAHPLGYWSKKIHGKLHHIGRWGRIRKGKMEWVDKKGGWQAAFELFESQVDDLYAGHTPRVKGSGKRNCPFS